MNLGALCQHLEPGEERADDGAEASNAAGKSTRRLSPSRQDTSSGGDSLRRQVEQLQAALERRPKVEIREVPALDEAARAELRQGLEAVERLGSARAGLRRRLMGGRFCSLRQRQ